MIMAENIADKDPLNPIAYVNIMSSKNKASKGLNFEGRPLCTTMSHEDLFHNHEHFTGLPMNKSVEIMDTINPYMVASATCPK